VVAFIDPPKWACPLRLFSAERAILQMIFR
jgi:hypothetical protein